MSELLSKFIHADATLVSTMYRQRVNGRGKAERSEEYRCTRSVSALPFTHAKDTCDVVIDFGVVVTHSCAQRQCTVNPEYSLQHTAEGSRLGTADMHLKRLTVLYSDIFCFKQQPIGLKKLLTPGATDDRTRRHAHLILAVTTTPTSWTIYFPLKSQVDINLEESTEVYTCISKSTGNSFRSPRTAFAERSQLVLKQSHRDV
jgi:hypothetical protein